MAVYNNMMVGIKKQGGKIPTYQSNGRQSAYSEGSGVSARVEDVSRTFDAGSNLLTTGLNEQIKAGEGLGAAINNAGKEFSDIAVKQEQLYTDTKATELALEYRKRATELLNNKDNTGLLQLQQESAQGAAEAYKKNANDIMREMLDGMSESVKSAFYGKVNDYNLSNLGSVQQHEGKEFRTWQVNTHTAAGKQYGDNAVQYAENPEMMAEYCRQAGEEFLKVGQLNGLTGEALGRYSLENVSGYVSGAIGKVAKNDVKRAEMMLEGAQKYMTGKDIVTAQNAIENQKTILENRALRAEMRAERQAAAQQQKVLTEANRSYADGEYQAVMFGDYSILQNSVAQLEGAGLQAQADELRSKMEGIRINAEVNAQFSKCSLGEMQEIMVGEANKIQTGYRVNTAGMTPEQAEEQRIKTSKEYGHIKAQVTAQQAVIKKLETGYKSNPVETAMSRPFYSPAVNAKGEISYEEHCKALDVVYEKDGVPMSQRKYLSKTELADIAKKINESQHPFSDMKYLEGAYGGHFGAIVSEMASTEHGVKMPNFGVLTTIDPKLADKVAVFQRKVATDAKVKEAVRAYMTKQESKTSKWQTLAEDDFAEIMRTFPDISDKAEFMDTVYSVASMYAVNDGMDEDKAMEKAMNDIVLSKYKTTEINGQMVRLPAKDSSGAEIDESVVQRNLEDAKDDFCRNVLKYPGLNPEQKEVAIQDMRKRIGVLPDGKGGFVFTKDGVYLTEPVIENGKDTGKKKFMSVNSTLDSLNTDWLDLEGVLYNEATTVPDTVTVTIPEPEPMLGGNQ